ncbi:DMT family transporter [Cellulosilyticum sp. I15G10I2]|uniref:DMT family transporter n=1 Tax=Cellulosilyticum sp. I15G10I2 TaxID=1892843 RepID=UPI00085C5568|nr:DMT family transporter [Cellulosilyticum sp. I15G10I2]
MLKNKLHSSNIMLITLIAVLCNILWGTPFPVLKIIYKDMGIISSNLADNITFISLRFLLAGLLLFIFGLLTGAPLFKIRKSQIRLIVTLGIFNTTLQYFFFNIGVNNTTGIKASILAQISIFFSILLAHFIYQNDKLSLKKVLGLLLGFGGLILVNLDKSSEGLLRFSILGEGFMICSGLVSAFAMLIAKKIGKDLPSLVFTCWQMLVGSILLFLVGLGMGGNPLSLHFTPLSIGLLFYLALVSSVAFYLWYAILQHRKISELAMFKFIIPVTGSVLTGLFIPGETLLPVHFISLLLVSAGIIIVNRK